MAGLVVERPDELHDGTLVRAGGAIRECTRNHEEPVGRGFLADRWCPASRRPGRFGDDPQAMRPDRGQRRSDDAPRVVLVGIDLGNLQQIRPHCDHLAAGGLDIGGDF